MQIMHSLTILFCFLIPVVTLPEAAGKTLESIGEVTYVRGNATRMPHGSINETALKTKDLVFAKDYVITKKASMIRLALSDKTVLTMGPNTRLNLARYEFKEGGHRHSLFKLVSGKLRAVIEKQVGQSDVTVETKTASLAIRGTEFVIDGQINEKNEQVIQIALLEGKLQITDKVTSKTYPLLPGEAYLTVINSTNTNYNSNIFDMNQESVQKLAAASNRILDSGAFDARGQVEGELALGESRPKDGARPGEKVGLAAPSVTDNAMDGMFIEVSPSTTLPKSKGAQQKKLKKRLQELDREWK